MDVTAWSDAAREAFAHYHRGNFRLAIGVADAAGPDDREALLAGALSCAGAFDLPNTRGVCQQAFEDEPRDSIDRRLRLLGAFATSFMSGDPAPLLQEIEAALGSGDPWLEGAALEHRLEMLAVPVAWNGPLPFARSWENQRDCGMRAVAAYQRAGDRMSAMRICARLAAITPDPGAREVQAHVRALGWEARNANDTLGLALYASVTAVLTLRQWMEFGAGGKPPWPHVNEAFERAAAMSAPLYAAEVHAVLGEKDANHYQSALQLFENCGALYRAFIAARDLADAHQPLRGSEPAVRILDRARDLADRMSLPSARSWSRLRLAEAVLALGRPMEAVAYADDALKFTVTQRAEAPLLLSLGKAAFEMHDVPRAINILGAATVLLKRDGETETYSSALCQLAIASAGLHNLEAFAMAIGFLQQACAIDRKLEQPEAEAGKLPHLVELYTRTVTHSVRAGKEIPRDAREGAEAAIARFRELAAAAPGNGDLQASLFVAEAYFEYGFGSKRESLRKFDQARDVAASDRMRAHVEEGAGLFSMQVAGESRDVELLRRADESIEAAYRAAERSGGSALEGRAHDSARVNALLAKLEADPAARAAAAAKARERVQRAIELYERANRFHRSSDPASAMEAQLGLHRRASRVHVLAIQVHLQNGDRRDAFEALERLKSTVLAGALAFSSLRPPDGVDAKTIDEERELLQAATLDRDAGRRAWASERLDAIWDRMRDTPGAERYVSLRRGETVSWRDASRLVEEAERELGDGRKLAVVAYFVTGEYPLADATTYAFILRGGDAEPTVVPIEISRDRVIEIASLLRSGAGNERWAELAPLVAPIAEHVRRDDVVCLVPADHLFRIPLHAIPVGGHEPLIARNPVFYAPSVTALRMAVGERRLASESRSAAVFGDPRNNLEFATREAEAVARQLGVAPALRERATRAAFLEALRTHDIVHFAGHASFDRENALQSGIVLADGDLTAEELMTVRDGRADLVVLSGCETGVNVTSAGDDEIVGLTRAFLYGGASSLVQTLWRVEDVAAGRLMVDFYTNWLTRSMPRVDAMRAAILTRRDVTNDPFFWAPFTLVGDWR